jgi:hypothetical protein
MLTMTLGTVPPTQTSDYKMVQLEHSMLMLGREIELPVDLIYGPHPQSEEFPDETQAVFAYSDNMQKQGENLVVSCSDDR